MRNWGIAALLVGVGLAGFALFMTTTAPQTISNAEVYNLGLLQTQSLMFTAGCAFVIIGVVLLAAGLLQGRIVPPATKSSDDVDAPVGLGSNAETQHVPRILTPDEYDRRREKDDRILYWIGGIVTAIVLVVLFLSWK